MAGTSEQLEEPDVLELVDTDPVELVEGGELWTPALRAVAVRLMERAQRRPAPRSDDGEQPDAAVRDLWVRLSALPADDS